MGIFLVITRLMPYSIKSFLRKCLQLILTKSLKKAAKEQRLNELIAKLEKIVPDIKNQYSQFEVNTPYLKTKVRGLHAFQISLVNEIIKNIKNPVIVDIGDSAGTHLQYIIGLYSNNKDIQCLGINLDVKAIERIKAKGLEAVHARVEDLQSHNINADIFLCFETLEHLMAPCQFLYKLSSKTNAEYLIVTVPYLKNSRVGLHHIRGRRNDKVYAENTHIFELSPQDWKLIISHSGWRIVREKIYYQYPRRLPIISQVLSWFWRHTDFEGFWGAILEKDTTISNLYQDWEN